MNWKNSGRCALKTWSRPRGISADEALPDSAGKVHKRAGILRLRIIAVGGKMPGWVDAAVDEYARRLPRELSLEWVNVALGKRPKSGGITRAVAEEGKAILRAVAERDTVIALDVKGKGWTTEQLAENLFVWQASGSHYSLLIGGPDGLSEDCTQRASIRWSLSPLTLPHPLVRVLLAEQLYRAWSINAGHPYHK